MMKKWVILFVFVCSCANIFGQQGCCDGSKHLELYPTNTSLYFVQAKNSEQMMKIKEKVSKSKDGEKIIASLAGNDIIVNSRLLGVDNYISDIYQDKDGYKLIMLPRFAIKMKDGYDIEEVLSLYGERLFFDKKEINIYMVDCNADNAEDVLAINTKINLLESVEWCEPMMIGEARKCNEFASSQYYIKNTGQNGGTAGIDINVEPVWNILSANTSLIVAVLDDGVERDHEDLNGAVIEGMTIDCPNEYGDPINEYGYNYVGRKGHGTACAGIIAAKNNTTGIRGVASGVKILPINIHPYPYSIPTGNSSAVLLYYEKIKQAIIWAYNTKGADIISCSWSFSNNTYMEDALNNAMTYGRNGKGTVVVCAAGNENPDYGVCFPANMSGTIAVGAVNNTGTIWDYSSQGSSLDIVAPSGDTGQQGDIVTTDRTGNYGFNPYIFNNSDLTNTKYTQRFGGTSAACPQVAGVAALMLSANPNLTVSQVRTKLRNTARDLGPTGFDTTYGYGLVDAYAAVYDVISAAVNSANEIVGPQLVYTYGQYKIENLPSGVTVTWSLSNSHYNNYSHLISNFPALGWCLVFRDNNYDMMNDTLKAEIKLNNVTIKTLRKNVYAYDDFWGQYTSGNKSGNINYTHIFSVNANVTTCITSPNFYGATVTYDSSGATPTGWYFNSTNGTLYFIAPTNPSGISIPVVINVHDGCGNDYVLYAFVSNSYNMSVSNGEDGITVALIGDGDSEMGLSQDMSWTVEVRSATTGQLMATQSSTSRSETISTAGWPKGIYIVKVTVGKEVLTEKVVVK